MGFRKTIIYGAKCDKCGFEALYRIENPSTWNNPTKTGTVDMFKRLGWKVSPARYLCPDCKKEATP